MKLHSLIKELTELSEIYGDLDVGIYVPKSSEFPDGVSPVEISVEKENWKKIVMIVPYQE
jgi:hypothetical protein